MIPLRLIRDVSGSDDPPRRTLLVYLSRDGEVPALGGRMFDEIEVRGGLPRAEILEYLRLRLAPGGVLRVIA